MMNFDWKKHPLLKRIVKTYYPNYQKREVLVWPDWSPRSLPFPEESEDNYLKYCLVSTKPGLQYKHVVQPKKRHSGTMLCSDEALVVSGRQHGKVRPLVIFLHPDTLESLTKCPQ